MNAETAGAVPANQGKTKIVNLRDKEVADRSAAVGRPQARRRRLLALSFILVVVLPVFIGSIYFTLIQSDRYVASAGFAVRGVNAGGGLDVLGAFTGLASSGSTTSDSYIVLKYLKSRDLVERLQADIDLRALYETPLADPLSRLAADLSIEEAVDYWSGMISTSFDATSGIITFDIEAFRADDARKIADLVLQHTQELVNQLSESARRDAVAFAQSEVERAEVRLRQAMAELRKFQESEQSFNPAESAKMQAELLAQLNGRLTEIQTRMRVLGKSVKPDAPSMVALQRQADAIQAQINKQTEEMTGSADTSGADGSALPDLLERYETLNGEKDFAQRAYTSALASLEQARVEAGRRQRYLAVYSAPALPQEATQPRRLHNVLLLVFIVTCLWGIGTLIVYSVRDHLS
ncbi:Capsule polysaccharide export protein-like protein [uncultured Pleomorphomonas sp.]|uniref:Capsule polysaccharide export protein-like protein n=1 Tax=uncultured Pleomorphomonas sp. TaxID=442121 RepID=A0A212LG37_9HYPH|nr:lipopolysaccharide biosynthesis protein [uncultured Pleomorphomonas sp.]SCM76458.1 Capsule polysaccharide export protein-like protein [uncultured Pleomorphomonas sp.]